MERIYIGGLDPPRLTAEEVASRLDGIVGVEIRSKDLVGNDKNFFYINAVSKDGEMSALDVIAKQYNNVTWKRCKLVVQAARPHFLERLAQERLEREQEQEKQDVKETQSIPRHLRIRQKFGEEAHQVDTKPCHTTEWADFSRVVSKLRTRREQHSETMRHIKHEHKDEVLMAKKKAFRNRAVHLRWSENMNGNTSEPSLVDIMSDASANENSLQDTSSTSDQSESESDVSSESKSLENGKHSKYVWSDDESEESSNEEYVADGSDKRGDRGDFDKGQGGVSSDEIVSSESENEDEEDEVLPRITQDAAPVEKSSAQYEWSSDDTDEEADDAPRTTTFPEPETSKVTAAEFSAAIDFSDNSSDDDSENEDSEFNERIGVSAESQQSLDDDVKANLGILSSLFPEMAETKPVSVNALSNIGGGHGGAHSETMQPGWETGPSTSGSTTSMSAGLGLMQRFDPTKESAKKYIIEKVKPAEGSGAAGETETLNGSQEDSSSKSESAESSSDESESATKAAELEGGDAKAAVYEQSKLEGIFRQARSSSSSETFKMSSMFDGKIQESGQPEKGKAFAFGFDVSTEAAGATRPTESGGAFTFGFDLGTQDLQDSGREGESESSAVAKISENGGTDRAAAETNDGGSEQTSGEISTGIQRRGLFFPEDTLDGYTSEFFRMNEGDRILQDPQGFLRDEGVKQQWKKERHALTLDWKRKRKYAQSRMQKKMKFR